ncbi:MAG TPA: helix-turn-helix transcriptional regulator [Caulobacteraceae bacterium]|jgi:transcriptional regulator with XRE-family HTH domain|nr:helix-turn-helix transcriptional regulator [Caulobacteraceae bacterium]
MSDLFHQKLTFVLKALSISRGALAAELGVDKSVVSRWATGRVQPSDHNLARLSALIAGRAPGFGVLDWERSTQSLAALLGADPAVAPGAGAAPGDRLRLPLLDQSRFSTERRGGAYVGIFRSTRPYAQMPGRFMHDAFLIRPGEDGDLTFVMMNRAVKVEGVCLLLQNQLFAIGAEMASGAFCFAIFNGVNTPQAGLLDGLVMWCLDDRERTPVAAGIVLERVWDLTGDPVVDQSRLAELCYPNPIAPEGSLTPELVAHLSREIGPSQIAVGGDWLLSLRPSRSLSRGLLSENPVLRAAAPPEKRD